MGVQGRTVFGGFQLLSPRSPRFRTASRSFPQRRQDVRPESRGKAMKTILAVAAVLSITIAVPTLSDYGNARSTYSRGTAMLAEANGPSPGGRDTAMAEANGPSPGGRDSAL